MAEGSSPQSSSAVAAHALLLGGAGAAIFLAGGAPQGNAGVFLLCAGVALVACPPRVRVERRLWAAAAGLALCAGLAFLPARWWPVPLWRRVIGEVAVVTLPGTITAAPGETAYWLAVLALSLIIGLFALAQPVRARGMGWLVLAAVTGCAVYAGLAMYAKLSGWIYPFSGGASFGFLPNRNHTATLLITGCVLSAGLMSVAFRDRRWLVADAAVAGGVVCMVALFFFSESRAGVLVLLAGGALWLAGLNGRHRPAKLWMAAMAVAVVAGGLFLAVKSPARDRMLDMAGIRAVQGKKPPTAPVATPEPGGGSAVAAPTGAVRAPVNPPSEFRVSIYRDALDMIRDQPWTGTGLGTFAGVFPQYRRASLVGFNAVHPESDWLMLLAECGVPAFACATVLVALAGRRLAGLGEHPYWPLRWGCAAAALAAVMHSAVDVPAHREAMGWWMLALGGLALQRQGAMGGGNAVGWGERSFNAETRRTRRPAEGGGREKGEEPEGGRWWGGVQRGVFVLGGVGALVLGGSLVRAEWFHGAALPPFAAEAAPQRMFEAYQKKEYAAGTALARRMLRDSPLNPATYYYLGIFLAVSDEEGVDQQVDEMFQAERALDPVMPDVPQHQSLAWAGYDPARQTALTLAELGRFGRIDRALGRGWPFDLAYYGDKVAQAAGQPDVQRYLLAATRPDPRFAGIWARAAAPALVQSRVDQMAADETRAAEAGGERGVPPVVEPDWYLQPENKGPAPSATTKDEGEQTSGWEQAGWAVRLRQRIYAGKYRDAVSELTRRYGISLELPGAAGSEEAADGAAGAFVAAWRGGDQEGAKRGLAAASVDVNEPSSLEVWRWRAALAAQDGKWKEAWLLLERYVRHTRQMEWP